MTDTTITIDEQTRNELVKIKYSLGHESMNEVVLSLINISKKVERANALASSTKKQGGSSI